MNISLNWLKDYLDIPLNPDQTSELLTDIGLEVEGMEVVESIKGGLKGVVIGKVLECGQHPNADRLSLTKVDIGAAEPLQIVCGAPNVAQGQTVVVAKVGTTLHKFDGESLTLKKGKIRGEVSEGMICAEDEIGLGGDHDGIMVLEEEIAPGTAASDYFKLENDIVYEIGLTPNRSDATSHIGVARDLAAALKINHNHSGKVNWPSVDDFKVENNDLHIDVTVENTEACPRYSGVSITGLKIAESPDWLKHRLNAVGVRPINNVVDITNFVLHELGQPLHAFDADKIAGNKIIVKTLPDQTIFKSLDEIDRKLSSEDLMICDGDSKGMCIGGVFGGIDSGVTDNTVNVFLEAAHFDARWIRRTSTRHLLRTDAAMCFEKGSDPAITVYALKRAAMLFCELAGGTISSEIVDVYPNEIQRPEIDVSYKNVNRLIGVEIPPIKIKEILSALEIEVLKEDEEGIRVAVSTSRADVLREADIIEEVLRIYGINNVPNPKYIRTAISNTSGLDERKLRNALSEQLAGNGFNEIMAVSLTQSKYFKEIFPVAEEELVYVNNTSNVHLDVMRPTMLFSGLEAIVHNQNRRNADLRLFEWGRTYKTKPGFSAETFKTYMNQKDKEESIVASTVFAISKPKSEEKHEEKSHLSLFLTGKSVEESWLVKESTDVNFYSLKAFVNNILGKLGLEGYQETSIAGDETNFWAYAMKYHRGPKPLVEFGQVSNKVLRAMDVKKSVFYAVFNWGLIIKSIAKKEVEFEELVKYPSIRRDLALVIDNSINFSDIVGIAKKTGKKLLKEINLFDVYENEEQLGSGKKSYAVSFVFEDASKTLKDKEVEKVMGKLIQNYEGKLGAVIRR